MSDPSYLAANQAVVEAFLAAFPEYVARRAATLAPAVDLTDAVRQGLHWLEGELGEWARLDASHQRRGPLQIFQTAFAFPTAALETAGVAAPQRDAGAASALPGDAYGITPASSRDIGEDAWRAHIAWGVSKAKLVAAAVPKGEPGSSMAVAVVTMNQADRAAVHLVTAGRGIAARHWRNPGAISAGLADEIPRWSVVDGAHQTADDAVRTLAAAGSKVAVYGPEPDDIAMARWMALGAATVVPHGRLVAVLESWLPLQA